MIHHPKTVGILTSVLTLISVPSIQVFAHPPVIKALNTNNRLSFNSYGHVKIGMTLNQAKQSTGEKLLPIGNTKADLDSECGYVSPLGKSNPPVAFMVRHSRIVRMDIRQKTVQTLSGLSLGMSENRLKTMYHPLTVEPSKYIPGGHTYTYRSKLPAYATYSMRFETDGKTVTAIRSGKAEEVSWVEGCS